MVQPGAPVQLLNYHQEKEAYVLRPLFSGFPFLLEGALVEFLLSPPYHRSLKYGQL